MLTGNERVLNYIKKYGSINQKQAIDYLGILRLSARIWDLRQQGNQILTEYITVKNRYGIKIKVARYSFAEEGVQQ